MLLTIVMVVGLLPTAMAAEGDTPTDPVTYTVTITADKNEVAVGETVTLTAVVTADGNVVSDAHVDWEAPTGNNLTALGSLQASITPGSVGEIEVKTFYDPTPEDVENDDVVEGTVTVTVTAKEIPVITVEFEPNNQITTEGKIIESLLYQVSVSDGTTPSYQWYQCDDTGKTNARKLEGKTSRGFELPKDLTAGKYYYYCVASAEGAESTTSRVTIVTVKKAYNFAMTADPAEGGTVTATVGSNNNVTQAVEGTNIRLAASANEGYIFAGWTVDGSVVSTAANYVFTMPDSDASVTASFEKEKAKLTVTQTVSEANWYPDMSMRVSYLDDFFTVTKADGSAFTMFDVVVTDSQGTTVERLENAGTYTLTLTMGTYYQKNYALSEDTFTFTVKPLDLTSTRVGTFTALNPTYTGQTALPTATTSGKLNFRVYIDNVFVGEEKMYSVDANDGLWKFAAIDGKNSVEAGDAWAKVVSKSSNIIGTYEYKYTIEKAEMDAPTGLVAINETIDGKGDGRITGLTTAMEYSTSKYGTYTPVTDVNMLFKDDTYYIRTAASSTNHEASDPVELTIAAGRKLTVSVPGEQQNYTLTASKTELSWHGRITLTIAFDTGYGAGDNFAVMVNNEPVTLIGNKVTISDVEEDLVVTVTGVQANEYTLSFDTNGGTTIAPITVTYGEKYDRLPSSAITGLSGGDSNWYLVDESGKVTDTKITRATTVATARNHTLRVVRKVLAPTLKITLEVPGGLSNDYPYYIPGNSTRILSVAVNNENQDVLDYTYQWYKDGAAIQGATEAALTLAGNVSDSGTYKVVVTATLKDGVGIAVTESSASGEKEQAVRILRAANTLSYDANSGENAPASHYTGGATITVSSDAPVREHYTFAGWNTETDGSGDNYSAGSTYTFANDNGNGGCKDTLYAKWTANTYAVTLVTNQGTIREGDVTEYAYGVGAALPTNVTRPGYRFAGWYDNEACTGDPVMKIAATEYGDKTFYAKWKRNSSGSGYRPEINDDGNGDVSVYPTKPEKGDIVTIKPDPDKGYEVDEVIVTDKNGRPVKVVDNGDGTYSFRQPDGKVEITVTFTEIGTDCDLDRDCPMYGYTDLSMTAWYHDGVHFCLEEGLMNGISNDQFAPNGITTRAMIVTILWRLEGKPVVNYLMQFDDVAADMWYTEAIRWAASEGIVEGYGNNFGPNDPITREQMAAIMWRYAKYRGYDVGVGENTNILSYDDAFDVSDWAIPAMQWACGAGLINGIETGKAVNLAPNGNTTRAQAAAILYRFCK